MGKKAKSNLSLNRTKGWTKNKNKIKTLKPSFWPSALEEIYRPTSYNPPRTMSPSYERVSWKSMPCVLTKSGTNLIKRITPLKTTKLQSPSSGKTNKLMREKKSVYCAGIANCKKISFSPVKSPKRSTFKSPNQKNSQYKRIYNQSPRKVSSVVRVTPSKSPAPKKAKKSLASYYTCTNELQINKENNPQEKCIHTENDSTNNLNSASVTVENDTIMPLEQTYNCVGGGREELLGISEKNSIQTDAWVPLAVNDTETTDIVNSCDNYKVNTADLKEMSELLPKVLENLSSDGFNKTMLDFFKLVASNEFPVQNIAFLLWTEIVKWYSCKSTTSMRYSDSTKKFWKLGYKLFGGRFVCFMSGFKNSNQVVLQETSPGNYDPTESEINFAVPDIKSLQSFEPYDIEYDSGVEKPGISTDMIKRMAKAMNGKSCCVTFDGKKLKSGLTKTDGDVNLFGFEKGPSLADKKESLEEAKKPFIALRDEHLRIYSDDLDIKSMSTQDKTMINEHMLKALRTVSTEILEVIELRKKKVYAKEKLVERSEGDWKNSKYVYGISAMIACIHEIDEFLNKGNELLDEIIGTVCSLNGERTVSGKHINLKNCNSYREIHVQNIESGETPTREVKQRSELWFERRKTMKVTGSTIFKAIGLDGLNRQKEHFDSVVCGVEEQRSETVESALQYGTQNEVNATSTFVGKVMPLLFPGLLFCEEGFVEKVDSDNNPFMIISPDGSIRHNQQENSTVAAVEFKCPLNDIHAKMPSRYLLQCLSEIEALNVNSLLYLCWRPDLSSLFKVKRNTALFNEAFQLAHQLYATNIPRRPTKTLDETKRIKTKVESACRSDTVEFVGLVPSLWHDPDCQNVYTTDFLVITTRRLKWILQQILDSYDKHYELKWEKASEAVVFLSCDLDRKWEENKIRCAPICWFTKGYSLDTETMRNILEGVLNACFKEGMHVPATSFDGQWHNIAVRKANGSPLTLLQLQKDIWKLVEGMSKRSIMKEIESLNTVSTWHFENVREDGGNANKVIICTNSNAHVPKVSSRLKYMRTKEARQKSAEESEELSSHQIDESDQSQEISHHSDIIQVQGSSESSPMEPTIEVEGHEDTIETVVTDSSEQHQATEDHDGNDATDINQDQRETHLKEAFNLSSATAILAMLRTDPKCNNKHQWIEKSPHDVQNIMGSYKLLKSLRDVELKVIVRFLKKTSKLKINESDSKEVKLTKLSNYLKLEQEQVAKNRQIKRTKNQNVKALSDLAYNVMIKSVKKAHLNIIYSEYLWQSKCDEWYTNFPLKLTFPNLNVSTDLISDSKVNNNREKTNEIHGLSKDPKLSDEDTGNHHGFFYRPSYSIGRQQVEISCVDSSHLLTRTRRKICKGGLNGISNAAWRKVAKSKNTNLSLGMIDCILEPMSVPVAVTHISERVEIEMRKNGDHNAADLCRDIRLWWRAEDEPGIKAEERFKMRLPLRNRLLRCHDVAQFPPPGMLLRNASLYNFSLTVLKDF